MANRHLARSIVLQTLYEVDFRDLKRSDIPDILKRNADDMAASGTTDVDFMDALLEGVLTKQKDLDKVIEKAAPQWPLDKISIVDRNILRVGLYELLFGDRSQVPPKVAINEAIELAKSFGGDTSSRFVNGVLGAVYKELGEPDKDAKPIKKKKKKDVPYEEMPIERLGGAVVYARHEDDVYLAFVHDVFGHWTLSKGKLEANESLEEGTAREIKEEMGLDITIQEKLGENEYIANDPEIGKKRKQVVYFLGESEFKDLKLGSSGGLDDAQWFKLANILDLNFYDDILPIITKAINILLGNKDSASTEKE